MNNLYLSLQNFLLYLNHIYKGLLKDFMSNLCFAVFFLQYIDVMYDFIISYFFWIYRLYL